ncbi:MAG: hypothetical protein KDC87_10760 [Planctomycetes bacterium]|nr:hypothetical protein [Planctomycetota bacterium]MCB9870111.1 hypothetical protein [Planctomycetota bacterium]
MSHPATIPFLIPILASILASGCANRPDPGATARRVGTYDGRAVAIAYAGSTQFGAWMKQQKARHDSAKQAGDTSTVREIEQAMQAQQERFHDQAFRGTEIDDILGKIGTSLQEIRKSAGVARLERINQPRAAGIDTVDVTDRLVALFAPDERARKWIRDIRAKPFPAR